MNKILFIGTEDKHFLLHRSNLIKFALSKKITVELACKVNQEKTAELLDIKLHNWRIIRGSKNIFYEILSIIRLYKIIKFSNPDIIHSVAMKPVLYSVILNLIFFRKKIIFALGGLGYIFNSNKNVAKILQIVVNFILFFVF